MLGSPDDAAGDSQSAKIVRFQLMKDNAEKFESNHQIAEKKMDAVREAGQFRVAKNQKRLIAGLNLLIKTKSKPFVR